MPSPTSVSIDAALTGYVLRSGQFPLVAEQIAPVQQTKKISGKYWKYDDAHLNSGDVVPRAARARSGEIKWGTSQGTYYAKEYPLKTAVEQDTIDNSDEQIDPMANAALIVAASVKLGWEKRLQTLASTSGNFATVNAAGAAWTSSGTTIEADIDVAKEGVEIKSGFSANTIIIPPAIARQMKRNATIRDLLRYTHSDLLVNGDLPPTLWGLRVVIPGARGNSANEGQAQSVARLWPASGGVQVLYVDPNPGSEGLTWASTFRWSGFGMNGEGVRTWWVDDGRYWYVEFSMYQDEAIVSTSAGALITGV